MTVTANECSRSYVLLVQIVVVMSAVSVIVVIKLISLCIQCTNHVFLLKLIKLFVKELLRNWSIIVNYCNILDHTLLAAAER